MLHIPASRPVDVAITTVDVIHSFWVPRLAGKFDAIPGHVNVLRIEADAPGDYAGVSAEFSGRGYTRHRFIVRAHDEAAWNGAVMTAAWVGAVALQVVIFFALRSRRFASHSSFIRGMSLTLATAAVDATLWTLLPIVTTSICL